MIRSTEPNEFGGTHETDTFRHHTGSDQDGRGRNRRKQRKKTAPKTPATSIHGAPGNTLGFDGRSANSQGGGKNGGGGIHNIAGGAPGQNGGAGTGGKGGPSGNMHGGLDATMGRFTK